MVCFCACVFFESVLISCSALKVYCNLIFCICLLLYFIFICVYVYKVCSKIMEEELERMLEVFLRSA